MPRYPIDFQSPFHRVKEWNSQVDQPTPLPASLSVPFSSGQGMEPTTGSTHKSLQDVQSACVF